MRKLKSSLQPTANSQRASPAGAGSRLCLGVSTTAIVPSLSRNRNGRDFQPAPSSTRQTGRPGASTDHSSILRQHDHSILNASYQIFSYLLVLTVELRAHRISPGRPPTILNQAVSPSTEPSRPTIIFLYLVHASHLGICPSICPPTTLFHIPYPNAAIQSVLQPANSIQSVGPHLCSLD